MIRLHLCFKHSFRVHVSQSTHLFYKPAIQPIMVELPANINSPSLSNIAWYRIFNGNRKVARWCTSFDNYEEIRNWYYRNSKGPFVLEQTETWKQNVDLLQTISKCRKGKYSELHLDSSQYGVTPLQFQINGIWFLLLRKRALLSDQVGLGKTIQFALAWRQGQALGLVERALICSPKSLLYQTAAEFERATKHTPLVISELKPEEGIPLIMESTNPVVIINHHRLRDYIGFSLKPDNMIAAGLGSYQNLGYKIGERYDVFVLDEAQAIKNRTSQMARLLKTVSTPYLWLITATPLENSVEEIHSLLQFIDPFLFGSYSYFKQRYCQTDYFGRIVAYRHIEELKRNTDKVLLKREKQIIQKLMPTLDFYKVKLELLPGQLDLYNRFEEDAIAEMDQYERYLIEKTYGVKVAGDHKLRNYQVNVLALFTALRQICDHAALIDKTCRQSVKLDWLVNELKNTEVNWLVFTQWVEMQLLIAKALETIGQPNKLFLFNGQMSARKRQETVNQFKEYNGGRILLCTDAAKCGLNLPEAEVIVHVERHFNPAAIDQRNGRIDRLGSKGVKKIVTLMCKDTVEERIEEIIDTKRDLSYRLLEARPPIEMIMECLRDVRRNRTAIRTIPEHPRTEETISPTTGTGT